MKIKYILGCALLLLGIAANASAQLVAGSPEDRLFRQINSTTDLDEKAALCLQFEEEFPESKVLASLYTILMDIHVQKNDTEGILSYGEKVIDRDPNNVNALMTLSRTLAVSREDIPRAIEYGERAVAAVEAMKGNAPPPQFTQEQWNQYLQNTEGAAASILSYARTVQPAGQ